MLWGATLIHLLTGLSPADLPQKDSRIQFRDRLNLQSNLVDWLEKITELTTEKRFKCATDAKEALNSGTFTYHPGSKFLTQSDRQSVRRKLKYLRTPTLIKLRKDRGQLEILIPPGGLDRVDEIFNNGCGGLLGYFVMFSFALSFSIVIPGLSSVFFLLIVTKIFLLVGSKTEFYLDKNAARIYSKIFGLKHSGEICPNKYIEDVFVQRTGSIFQVALRRGAIAFTI